MKNLVKPTCIFLLVAGLSQIALGSGESRPQCTVTGVTSRDASQSVKNGNGFAVRPDLILITDHNLVAGSTVVDLSIQGDRVERSQFVKGRVVARDFHTDLALVKTDAQIKMTPCRFGLVKPQVGDAVTVRSFRQKNPTAADYMGRVTENMSLNLEVPGFETSLEIEVSAPGETLSGSPVLLDGFVVGAVNSEVRNLILAPSGPDLQVAFEALLKQYLLDVRRDPGFSGVSRIPRSYAFDEKTQSFHFGGLILRGDMQRPFSNNGGILKEISGEGNPHIMDPGTEISGEGNPHGKVADDRSVIYGPGFQTMPVSGSSRFLGYVVAKMAPDGFSILEKKDRELANRLATSKDNIVLIYKVDDVTTANILELLRTLEKSGGKYQITEALTGYIQPTKTNSDTPYLESIRDATNLLSLIDKAENLSPELKGEFSQKIAEFIGVLSRIQNQFEVNSGLVSLNLEEKAQRIWEGIDSAQLNGVLYRISTVHRLTTEERALRSGIRTRRPIAMIGVFK